MEDTNERPVYDNLKCATYIKKKHPWIPMCIIRKVLCAEDAYIVESGILGWWYTNHGCNF